MKSFQSLSTKTWFVLLFAGLLFSSCNDEDLNLQMMESQERERGPSTCPDVLEPFCPNPGSCEIFKVVEQMPRFFSEECENLINADHDAKEACAEIKMYEYLDSTIIYPAFAKENQIEGLAIVQFIVRDTLGCLEDIWIVREDDFGFGKELQRAVTTMPPFVIGKQRGRNVNLLFTLPYEFKLD